jgi:hypothetical protein
MGALYIYDTSHLRVKETLLTAVKLLVEEKAKPLPGYSQQNSRFVISVLRLETDEYCALLGYQPASSGNSLPTFGTTYRPHLQGFPETSVRNYHYSLSKNP